MYRMTRIREWKLPTGIMIARFTNGVRADLGRCQINHSSMMSTKDAIKLAKRWALPNVSTVVIITCRDGRVTTIDTDENGKIVVSESRTIELPNIIPKKNTNEHQLSRRKARKLAHVYRGSSRSARYVAYLSGERSDFYLCNNRLVKVAR